MRPAIILIFILLSVRYPTQVVAQATEASSLVESFIASSVDTTVVLSTERGISGGSFSLDDSLETKFDLYKLPLKHSFALQDDYVQAFLQPSLGFFRSQSRPSFGSPLLDDARLSTFSAGLTSGIGLHFFDHALVVEPSLGAFYSHVNVDYDVNSPESLAVLEPLIDDGTLNFSANTFSFVPGVEVRYRSNLPGEVQALWTTSYSYSFTDSYSSKRVIRNYHLGSSVIRNELYLKIPTGFEVERNSFFLVPHISRIELLGDASRALGVDSYYDLGANILLRTADKESLLDGMSLGFGWVEGKAISGWRVVLNISPRWS